MDPPTPRLPAEMAAPTAHYISGRCNHNVHPQPDLPHPVAYSSYHYPSSTYLNPNPNPNPNMYAYGYTYAGHNPEATIESRAHHAGELGFSAAADPYPEYAGSCGMPPSYSYQVGGAPPAALPAVPLYYGDPGGKEPLGSVMQRVSHPYDGRLIGYGAPHTTFINVEEFFDIDLRQKVVVYLWSYGYIEQGLSQEYVPHGKNKVIYSTSRSMKKRVPKGQKWTTMQSAYCEVCKVKCDTQEVLMVHKQGKKHLKNLNKLQESLSAKSKDAPIATPVEIQLKNTTSVENNSPATLADKAKATGESKRKRNAATSEDLEEKKRRVLEGGAAEEEVKVCLLCNVVVNSQKVYDYHIAGQKHALMLKKHQEGKVAA